MRLLCCSICIWLLTSANAQDVHGTLEMAESTLAAGKYEEAAGLFRRVIYFDPQGEHDARSISGLAISSFYSGDYELASRYFLALHRTTGSSQHYYYYILSLMEGNQLLDAKRAVLLMQDSTEALRVSKKIFGGLIAYRLRDFETATSNFQMVNDWLQIDSSGLNKVLGQTKKINRKKELTAVALSAMWPGMGQVYTGHVKEGIHSFLLIGGFGVVYWYALVNFGPIDGIISVLPWFHRYYVGGMNMAADLVDTYKEERFLHTYNELVLLYADYLH